MNGKAIDHHALLVNGRFRGQARSGVQRVAASYLAHLRTPHQLIEPRLPLQGLAGHLWEQAMLPGRASGTPLWSPCNVGPIFHPQHVVTIHDAAVFDHPEWFSRSFSTAYGLIVPRLVRHCLKVVTVSNFSRQRLIARLGIAPSRIEMVWNGVDDIFKRASREAIAAAKQKAGIRSDRYVLTLSTLEPRKNLGLVVAAWRRARSALPGDYQLVIAGKKGDPAIFGQGEAAAKGETGDMLFTGYVAEAELPGLISGADALVYPSLYEGFGLPVVEAMACGTPAITAPTGSLPEVAGDAALYVDPSDADALAGALKRIAESEECRKDYAGRGLERAKLFSWERAAASMDALFEAAFGNCG